MTAPFPADETLREMIARSIWESRNHPDDVTRTRAKWDALTAFRGQPDVERCRRQADTVLLTLAHWIEVRLTFRDDVPEAVYETYSQLWLASQRTGPADG